jgi:hypothetical protein
VAFLFQICLGSDVQDGDFSRVATKSVAGKPDLAGIAKKQSRPGRSQTGEEMPGLSLRAMALVQYPQITGDGLGNAPRPPLRLGQIADLAFLSGAPF